MKSQVDCFLESARQRIERLTKYALYANEHFKSIYDIRALYAESKSVFELAGSFFQTTVEANYCYIFMALSKMFYGDEKTDDSAIILLEKIKKNCENEYSHPFESTEFESTVSDNTSTLHFASVSDALKLFDKRVKKFQKCLKRIKKLRNKYYGHMDLQKSKDYSKLFKANPVTIEEMDQLLNLNFTICNCINALLNDDTYDHVIHKSSSLNTLVKYATRGIQEAKRNPEVLLHDQL